MSVWDTHRRLWLPAKVIRRTADRSYLIRTPAGSQYQRTRDHLKARHTGTRQEPEDAREQDQLSPVTVPRATTSTPTVAPATPATPDKSSALPLKPSPAPASPAKQPATPQPAKPTPAAPASMPVLRRSQRTIVPPRRLITE